MDPASTEAAPSPPAPEPSTGQVARYEAARAALAEARRFEDVHEVRNIAAAMKAYALEAQDRGLLADAIEIKLRAVRRLWELYDVQRQTIGLNPGTLRRGVLDTPRENEPPTLESLGIDKNLAKRVREIGALNAEDFEARISRARKAVIDTALNTLRSAAARGASVASVPEDVLEAIKGTRLDTDNYLGVLSKLPPEEQRRRVAAALEEAKPEPPPDERHQLALLIAAWERASEWARGEFLGFLGQMGVRL